MSTGKLSDFQNLTLIGKGSYGRVYRGTRISDKTDYALKELNIKSMNQKEREDATNEIRLLASIRHPKIIRYYESFIEDDRLFIVTEYARGGDLYKRIRRQHQKNQLLDEELIWSYFIQLCLGVRAMHQMGILHRDLKSPNIFISSSKEIKLGDLGVAKILKNGLANTRIGTPYYMSPEIWKNRPYNKKSDIWALGCLLYEFSTLRHPFDAKDERSLGEKVMRGHFSPIPQHYSADLTAMIRKCLQVDPSRRPTIQEIIEAPCVARRIEMMSQEEVSEDPTDGLKRERSMLISTIRVPRQLNQLAGRLPGSFYDREEKCSSDHTDAATRRSAPVSASVPSLSEMKRMNMNQQGHVNGNGSQSHRDGPKHPLQQRDQENRHHNRGIHQDVSPTGVRLPVARGSPDYLNQQPSVPISHPSQPSNRNHHALAHRRYHYR
jgi:NIMA (never in mitosis gene a)-related kinase